MDYIVCLYYECCFCYYMDIVLVQCMYLFCLIGNRLGDQGLGDFLFVLRFFIGLISFDLFCNGVIKVGLKVLVDCVFFIREEVGIGVLKVNYV